MTLPAPTQLGSRGTGNTENTRGRVDCEAAAPVRSLTPHLRGLTTSAVQPAVQAAVVLHNTHCPLARFGERANHPIQDSVDLSSAHQASDVQRAKPSTNQPSPITLKPDHRRMRGAHLSRSETKSKTAALRVNLMPKISEGPLKIVQLGPEVGQPGKREAKSCLRRGR